mmetsp:Transcript_3711/g.5398  ORF Transcript_3711/g.5398 Transcript_3711/m.5398 type:complete len:94 (-) Transcript_3711:431-712(-)
MKYVRPLYRALSASKFGKSVALDTFLQNADFYHPIARKMVASDLGVSIQTEASTSEEESKARKEKSTPFIFAGVAIMAGVALCALVVLRRRKL